MKYFRNLLGYPFLVIGVISITIGMLFKHGFDGTSDRINKMTLSLKKVK